jgi:hypothetical protein
MSKHWKVSLFENSFKSSPKKNEDKEKRKEYIPPRNKILKKELKEQFGKDNKAYLTFANWVIRNWGGIKNPPSSDKILKNKQNVFKGELSFDSISSFSKVASFLNDTNCAVYDSRVAFTLNWLIFINHLHKNDYNCEKDLGYMKFFQQPNGKNSDMQKHLQPPIFMKYFKVDKNKGWFTKN